MILRSTIALCMILSMAASTQAQLTHDQQAAILQEAQADYDLGTSKLKGLKKKRLVSVFGLSRGVRVEIKSMVTSGF